MRHRRHDFLRRGSGHAPGVCVVARWEGVRRNIRCSVSIIIGIEPYARRDSVGVAVEGWRCATICVCEVRLGLSGRDCV